MWARIENEIVKELTDVDPAGRFHESLVWVKATTKVEQGDVYKSGKFTKPTPVILTEEEVKTLRASAYKTESDSLFMEWQFDQTEEKRQQWISSVEAIKQRYPLPKEE